MWLSCEQGGVNRMTPSRQHCHIPLRRSSCRKALLNGAAAVELCGTLTWFLRLNVPSGPAHRVKDRARDPPPGRVIPPSTQWQPRRCSRLPLRMLQQRLPGCLPAGPQPRDVVAHICGKTHADSRIKNRKPLQQLL